MSYVSTIIILLRYFSHSLSTNSYLHTAGWLGVGHPMTSLHTVWRELIIFKKNFKRRGCQSYHYSWCTPTFLSSIRFCSFGNTIKHYNNLWMNPLAEWVSEHLYFSQKKPPTNTIHTLVGFLIFWQHRLSLKYRIEEAHLLQVQCVHFLYCPNQWGSVQKGLNNFIHIFTEDCWCHCDYLQHIWIW